ncbi:MAG: hypothetical protein AAB426_02140 [Myxococcota bacterium]
MRLTCLKCGHQIELATGESPLRVSCVCGEDYTNPNVINTGTRPNERAAERSRSKAFRAAGLVKNLGGFAFGIALLGILFFPVALVGAGVGIYVLTMVRGPAGRYSGRRQAALAVLIGASVFVAEGALALSWVAGRRHQRLAAVQASASEDLRGLLRAERLYRAMNDTYGTFHEFRFESRYGLYTLYLGPDDHLPARRDDRSMVDPLPDDVVPGVSEDAFTAVAVANLDSDAALDVWQLDERGEVQHVADDLLLEEPRAVLTPVRSDEPLDEKPSGDVPGSAEESAPAPVVPTSNGQAPTDPVP